MTFITLNLRIWTLNKLDIRLRFWLQILTDDRMLYKYYTHIDVLEKLTNTQRWLKDIGTNTSVQEAVSEVTGGKGQDVFKVNFFVNDAFYTKQYFFFFLIKCNTIYIQMYYTVKV